MITTSWTLGSHGQLDAAAWQSCGAQQSNRKIHLESLCTRVYVRHEHPGGRQRRAEMWDAIMLVAVVVAFFALAITYSRIDRL
jgi:hypothetical protein